MVHKVSIPNELEFQQAMVMGLARAAMKSGRGRLADKMGISGRALDKIFAGGATRAKHLFDAMAASDCVLDDIAALYQRKFVLRMDGDRSTGAAAPVVAALQKIIDMEADGVDDHRELLGMEGELRAADKAIGALIAKIEELRRPREVRA